MSALLVPMGIWYAAALAAVNALRFTQPKHTQQGDTDR